jgi:type I restriction enzyme S subunit
MKAGWEIKTLGEACFIARGGSPRPIQDFLTDDDDGINWVKISDATASDKFIFETKQKIKRSGIAHSRLVNEGDFLLSNSMSFGRPYIMKTTGCIHDGWLVLSEYGKYFDQGFLYHLLSSPVVFEQFDKLAAGSTVRNLNIELASRVVLPIPPLPEQKRLVTLLDEAFESIATAKANAQQNLKNARALFESHLNEVFTKRGEGWDEKTLQEITTVLGDGLHGTPKYTDDGDYYFINGNNLTDGAIEFKDSTKRVSVDEFKKHKKNLTDRTILVSINGTLGNVAFYNGEKVILGKSACYFNLKEGVDKNFVKCVFSSPYFLEYAHKEATGATIKNVSLKTMREFKVPLPPLAEQQTVFAKIDALSEETQRLEALYSRKIAALDELKKALLHRAFSGEL